MMEIYEVKEIEGKNLGCFALRDIKKGSPIIKEKSQISKQGQSNDITPSYVQGLNEAFNKMVKTDQEEYMKLHDQYADLSSLPSKLKSILQLKSQLISKITKSDEKLAKIIKIYDTNSFVSGVGIKRSRFNHSCKPNASSVKVNDGHSVIVAISNIKAGEEITISYAIERLHVLRKKKTRQQNLAKDFHFVCSCHLCQKEDDEDDDDTFEELINEIESFNFEKKALNALMSSWTYPPSKSRREVECYKELYRRGKAKKVQTICLFYILNDGFDAATQGYMNNKTEEFKIEAENFAKTADKFEEKLGSEIVTLGIPDFWKQKYQSFVRWLQRYMSGIQDY